METSKHNFEGANPNELRKLMNQTLQYGNTADLEILFDDGMDVNQVDFEDRTALMMKAAQGKKDAVEMLLRRGADVNRIFMYQGRVPKTALDGALENGKTEIADILIAHGAKTGEIAQSILTARNIEEPNSSESQPETQIMTFEQNGEKAEVNCHVIDLNTPEFVEQIKNAPLYTKKSEVKARQALIREEIQTALDATPSVAEPGDWVVTDPDGKVHRVKNEIFNKVYKPKEEAEGIFTPLGVPVKVKAIQVNEDVAFKVNWGNYQGVRAGGYIVERQDSKERFGVEKAAFDSTYEAIEEK